MKLSDLPKIILTQAVIKRGKFTPISLLSSGSTFKVRVLCPVCKAERYSIYSLIERTGHTACQACCVYLTCSTRIQIGETFGRLIAVETLNRYDTLFVCTCGKEVVKPDNEVRYKNGVRSCGCLRKDNRFLEVWRGEDHPRWKGGVSSERDRHMKTTEYVDWRKSVFVRDSYTCQKCSQVGGRLEAHHILSYAKFADIRCDTNNGITLCYECHKDFHSRFGRLTHTKSDMEDFLSQEEVVEGCLT